MWFVDFLEGMPDYWKHLEGPIVIVFGVVILLAALRLTKDGS
jgi:hypothetical protein